MTETTRMTITNVHSRGFGFAVVTKTGEQVFIPPHTASTITGLAAGDSIAAVLVPNPRQDADATTPTPWLAVKLIDSAGPEPDLNLRSEPEPESEPQPEPEETGGSSLDERAYTVLAEVAYASNADLAGWLGADRKSVSNAMQRLYNAGRISRAEVYHRVGQQRSSFVLYAMNANDFIAEEVE